MDTRGYTERPSSLASHGLTLPPELAIDAVDSVIEEGAVPAIAAFFASIAPDPAFLSVPGTVPILRRRLHPVAVGMVSIRRSTRPSVSVLECRSGTLLRVW